MIQPIQHPWCVRDGDGVRYFSNAPCAAATALEEGVPVIHPSYGTLDRSECMKLAGMSAASEAYQEWLGERGRRDRVGGAWGHDPTDTARFWPIRSDKP